MKLLEFKNYLQILFANIKYVFLTETAYRANTWAGIIGTIGFSIASIIFIEAVYGNVDTVAGYSQNEMLFFTLIAHLCYYTNSSFVINSFLELIRNINTGNFDLILIKPVSSLFFTLSKRISIYTFIKDAGFSLGTVALVIDWSKLSLKSEDVLIGLILVVLGQIGVQFLQFITTLPAFWIGESYGILSFSYVFDYRLGRTIPWEGLSRPLQVFFSTAIPVMIGAGIATSVMLNKSNEIVMLTIYLIVVLLLLFVEIKLWNYCLKIYSSASS